MEASFNKPLCQRGVRSVVWQQVLMRISPYLCCTQKMWLGGQTESFQNVGGGGGVKVYTMN